MNSVALFVLISFDFASDWVHNSARLSLFQGLLKTKAIKSLIYDVFAHAITPVQFSSLHNSRFENREFCFRAIFEVKYNSLLKTFRILNIKSWVQLILLGWFSCCLACLITQYNKSSYDLFSTLCELGVSFRRSIDLKRCGQRLW